MNLSSSSGTASASRVPIRNSYVNAFRHAIAENRIRQVENPRGSGFYTVGMDVRGLANDGSDVANLRRVFFRPRVNDTQIEILDNIIPLTNEGSFKLHTSNSQFEELYLHFINENLFTTPHIMGDVIIETVNDLRYFTEYNISNRLLFSASMTGNMESIW
ncbi:hypothetical protein, partial [Xenorhabdus sp. GDc328]|uniref:hypothetical protein n=1 Tax=Xenorhabdus sp. GDc328 TaxID=742178 RepID=UPI00128AFB0E